jgi:hypothetical protein
MVAKVKPTESEIVGLVQKKESNTIGSGPNQGNIYLSYLLADPQTGDETWYKQFNAVTSGEPVQVGEVWRFHVSAKPANNGTVFHNVEKVLGQAGTVDPRFAMADDMWDWVTKAGKPTELAAAFATWMQS